MESLKGFVNKSLAYIQNTAVEGGSLLSMIKANEFSGAFLLWYPK